MRLIHVIYRDRQIDRQTADRHLVANAGYEGLDVQLCWTALLAGSVSTLQTPGRLPESGSLTQCRVLDVIKILLLAWAGLQQRDHSHTTNHASKQGTAMLFHKQTVQEVTCELEELCMYKGTFVLQSTYQTVTSLRQPVKEGNQTNSPHSYLHRLSPHLVLLVKFLCKSIFSCFFCSRQIKIIIISSTQCL